MKQFFVKYRRHIMVTLGLLSLLLLLLSRQVSPLPKITAYTPKNESQNIDLRISPSYTSDTPLNPSDLAISSSPDLDFKLEAKNPNTYIATHSLAFQPATTYTLTLSWQGQVLQIHSFTTIKSQEDPLLIKNMKDELARDYPLAQKLPLKTSQYRVVYSAPLILQISIQNPNLTSQEVIDEVKAWVKSNGGDVDAHKYIIASPAN